jgi:hypothetical protein
MHKKVIVLVDNRVADEPSFDAQKSALRGSDFKGCFSVIQQRRLMLMNIVN